MTEQEHPKPAVCTLEVLALELAHLEEMFDLHRKYQAEQEARFTKHLESKLHEMNKFRDENKALTAQFATVVEMNHMAERKCALIDAMKKELLVSIDRNSMRLEQMENVITPHLGPRVMQLELAKSNLEGRFWALAAIVIIVQIIIQMWPFIHR